MFIERFAVACLTRTIHPRIALVNPLRVPTPPEGGVGEPTGGPHTSPATPATPRCSAPRWRSCSSPSRTATSRRPTRRRRRPRTAPPTARRRPAASDLRRALVLASAPVGRWLLHMKRRARRALAVTDQLSHSYARAGSRSSPSRSVPMTSPAPCAPPRSAGELTLRDRYLRSTAIFGCCTCTHVCTCGPALSSHAREACVEDRDQSPRALSAGRGGHTDGGRGGWRR